MYKHDNALIDRIDLPAAVGLLTRLPIAVDGPRAMDRGAASSWAYPLVGVIVGVVFAAATALMLAIGIPAGIVAGLVLAGSVILTGAMHEDGLADSADGLWGGWDKARRLEIMKDSAIGTYGVLALTLSVGLRWMTLAALLPFGVWPVIAAAALPRSLLPLLMVGLPNARGHGLSSKVGIPTRGPVAVAVLLGLLIGWIAVGPIIIGAWLVSVLCAMGLALLARSRIGGQTGDVLGAVEQLGEIAVLLTLLALAAH